MPKIQSDFVTPTLCRRILDLRRTGPLLGTSSIWIGHSGNVITFGTFQVVLERGSVTLLRVNGGRKRSLRPDELPRLEGRLRRIITEELAEYLEPPKHVPPLDVNMEAMVDLMSLILVRAPGAVARRAERQVRLAIEDPAAWLFKYGRRRGLRKPMKNLHIVAFFDSLTEARAAAELDHRSGPDEINRELTKLARRADFKWEMPEEWAEPEVVDIDTALGSVHRLLLRQGWDLLVIDIQSDSYPFFVVGTSERSRVLSLMRKVGMRVARI
jgi:hypothetical protein